MGYQLSPVSHFFDFLQDYQFKSFDNILNGRVAAQAAACFFNGIFAAKA